MKQQGMLSGSEWTLDDLLNIEQICASHAERYGLDTFPNQLEVITSEQMLDSYVSSGLPVNYGHWSFGKHYLIESGKYRSGAVGACPTEQKKGFSGYRIAVMLYE